MPHLVCFHYHGNWDQIYNITTIVSKLVRTPEYNQTIHVTDNLANIIWPSPEKLWPPVLGKVIKPEVKYDNLTSSGSFMQKEQLETFCQQFLIKVKFPLYFIGEIQIIFPSHPIAWSLDPALVPFPRVYTSNKYQELPCEHNYMCRPGPKVHKTKYF
jgi:hypothetical protein